MAAPVYGQVPSHLRLYDIPSLGQMSSNARRGEGEGLFSLSLSLTLSSPPRPPSLWAVWLFQEWNYVRGWTQTGGSSADDVFYA